MYEHEEICYAETKSPGIRIIAVKPLPNRMLRVTFSNGEIRRFDTKKLKGPAFAPLAEEAVFENPIIFHGILTWADGTIDVAPETVYAESQIDEEVSA